MYVVHVLPHGIPETHGITTYRGSFNAKSCAYEIVVFLLCRVIISNHEFLVIIYILVRAHQETTGSCLAVKIGP